MTGAPGRRVLVVRLDSMGDVLLAGPAVRAVAARAAHVSMLVSPLGAAAALLLPGVDDVVVWSCPWILADPVPVDPADLQDVVARVAAGAYDEAIVLTSFHQSALPTALLLRMAGVPLVSAVSADYPGSLLDLRHRVDDDLPEPQRALSLVAAAGYPPDSEKGLAVRRPLPDVGDLLPRAPYVVLHPGTSVPARAWPVLRWEQAAQALADDGWQVAVTGTQGERATAAAVARAAGANGWDFAGSTDLPSTAVLLDGARAVVVANTGPAHLAAAVQTPVVSLFAPTVPSVRWAPYGVPHVLLGDQDAPCKDSRAVHCPVPGHPCLSSVTAADVLAAVRKLTDPAESRGAA